MDFSSTDSLDSINKHKNNLTINDFDDLDKDLFRTSTTLITDIDSTAKKSSLANTDDDKKLKKKKIVAFQDIDDDEDILDDLLGDNSADLLNNNEKASPKSNVKVTKEKIADLFGNIKGSTGITSTINSHLESSNNDGLEFQNPSVTHKNGSKSPSSVATERFSTYNAPNSAIEKSSKPISRVEQFFSKSSAQDNKNKSNENISNEYVITEKQSSSLGSSNVSSLKSKSSTITDIFSPSFPSKTTAASGSIADNITPTMSASAKETIVKEPRRRIPRSNINIDDPLGLLSGSSNQYEEILTIKTPKEKSIVQEEKQKSANAEADDLPEWLGGTKRSGADGDSKHAIDPGAKSRSELTGMSIDSSRSTVVIDQKDELVRHSSSLSNYSGSQLPTDMQYGQHQQDQLLADHGSKSAAILSQQTDQLMSSIVENQMMQFSEQEKIFDALIKRQIDRQAMLESQIKLQHARMNHYIQALAKQALSVSQPVEHQPGNFQNSSASPEENTKKEQQSTLQSLELEKQNLEYMHEILKEKHQKEMEILKNSHETQINLMQESVEKLEMRLRREIEDLQVHYEEKIEKILNEKNQQEAEYKEQIENLKMNHVQSIKEIQERHSENINLLQKEHLETMKNITRAKELERETIDFVKSERTDINKMLEKSENVSEDLRVLYDEIKNRNDGSYTKREKSLKIQEDSLQAFMEQLRNQQELVNNERNHLTITAEKLQSEFSQITSQFNKNNELLNERETRLEIQEKHLIRERELFQEQCNWERQNLKSIKEAWIADQKQQIKLLADERETLAAEKGKLEVLSHLKSNSQDITRTELEAAVKAAYDAMYEANLERQRWKEKVDTLQTEQRRIESKERQLVERAKELEELTQSALVKREEGMRALKEAQRIEKQHKDRLNQLQTQLQLLSERENHVANEKLALARERLALKVTYHQAEENSESDTKNIFYNTDNNRIITEPNYVPPASKMNMHFTDIVDPQLLLLRFNLDNKLDTSHVLRNIPAIEE